MELKEGKMTLKDLSLWFGLKPDTITKSRKSSKERKFEILKNYAIYHFEGKSLIIDRVLYPTYTKAFEIIEEEVPKRWGVVKDSNNKLVNETFTKLRIDTCARVGIEIYYSVPEVSSQINLKTTKTYTNRVKRKQYGRNCVDEHGTRGYSEYVWLNETEDDLLPDDQLKIVKECAQIAYGDPSLRIANIDEDLKNGKISQEERNEMVGAIQTMDCFDCFQQMVIDRLGFYPKKRTKLIDEINWES